jgi:hypothetical protein
MGSDTADLPWPYNGIVNDLRKAVENGSNYLAALGMVCWSEFIGREIAKARGQRLKHFKCFKLFLSEYMQYNFGGHDPYKIYDTFRNGLAHEFGIKGKETAVAMRIYVLPGDRAPGLAYDPQHERHFVFVEEYLRDFEAGLRRWLTETGRLKPPAD